MGCLREVVPAHALRKLEYGSDQDQLDGDEDDGANPNQCPEKGLNRINGKSDIDGQEISGQIAEYEPRNRCTHQAEREKCTFHVTHSYKFTDPLELTDNTNRSDTNYIKH